jgi:hypothetical protein
MDMDQMAKIMSNLKGKFGRKGWSAGHESSRVIPLIEKEEGGAGLLKFS